MYFKEDALKPQPFMTCLLPTRHDTHFALFADDTVILFSNSDNTYSTKSLHIPPLQSKTSKLVQTLENKN